MAREPFDSRRGGLKYRRDHLQTIARDLVREAVNVNVDELLVLIDDEMQRIEALLKDGCWDDADTMRRSLEKLERDRCIASALQTAARAVYAQGVKI